MTAHECLLHPWLTGDHSKKFTTIDSSKYIDIRDKVRTKYDNWDSFTLPIGRLSEYSALRKLLIDKYRIQETSFGKKLKICNITLILIISIIFSLIADKLLANYYSFF